MLAALKRAKRQRRSEDQETIKQEDKKQIPSSVPTLSPTLPAVNRAERQPLLSMHSPETSNEPSSGEIDPVVFSRCAAAAPKKRLLMRVMAHNPSALQTSESIGLTSLFSISPIPLTHSPLAAHRLIGESWHLLSSAFFPPPSFSTCSCSPLITRSILSLLNA